jgi:phosphopantetheinyl transferase
VGIDIERRNPARDIKGLAQAAFGPTEAAFVGIEGHSAFYRIWTIREAISKATGDGMALVMDRVDRVPLAAADGLWVASENGWMTAHVVVAQELSVGLAVQPLENGVIAAGTPIPLRSAFEPA